MQVAIAIMIKGIISVSQVSSAPISSFIFRMLCSIYSGFVFSGSVFLFNQFRIVSPPSIVSELHTFLTP